ncbi:hypothetical protein PWT90_08379 [Aphanocladium album]|nr:hypothetical protein PWT90_08379 [Aphanocladium album]
MLVHATVLGMGTKLTARSLLYQYWYQLPAAFASCSDRLIHNNTRASLADSVDSYGATRAIDVSAFVGGRSSHSGDRCGYHLSLSRPRARFAPN